MAKLGVMIEGQLGLTVARWNRLIDAADSLGFESLWRSDHFFTGSGLDGLESPDLWPTLTMVALRSNRLRFGALVSPVTWRPPVELARNGAFLDQLSGGRFELGIGAGWNEPEHNAFGIPFPPTGVRMDMLEEAVDVIRLLWTGEKVDHQGKHYRLNGAQILPKPAQARVPVVIGGAGEKRLLRIVARHADEWNAVYTNALPDIYRHKLEVLERHGRDVGRDTSAIRRSWMGSHLIGRNRDDLLRRARRLKEDFHWYDEVALEALPDYLRSRGVLVGTPDEIVGQIQALEALGIERFMLQTLDMDDIAALELFAGEVMPRVR